MPPQKQHREEYALPRWGEGFFAVNGEGHLAVRPLRREAPEIDLHRLGLEVRDAGLAWPVLIRFPDLLHQRVRSLQAAFTRASRRLEYGGDHCAVYPIKVNQQRSVVEEILAGGGEKAGLEAGSKPELMAVLALSRPGGVVVCNGYKDREYVRLALLGHRLGLRVYLVLEKPGELELILGESERLGIPPLLGVRIRSAVAAASNWQNTGGEKSKFGFTGGQVLTLLERLRSAGTLSRLRLLHAHLGSQIPALEDIRQGMEEVAAYYAELHRLGAPLEVVDVGGGLGVDYEGTRSRDYCSIDYGLDDYAEAVVAPLAHVCASSGLEAPRIFTESGRAMTAHHAVLVTNVIERDPPPAPETSPAPPAGDPEGEYNAAREALQDAYRAFRAGALDLAGRASAEHRFHRRCRALLDALPGTGHDRLRDELHEKLADRLFLNFSIFQSVPDIWGVDQIFPVLPLQRLHAPVTRHALIHDLTCDSDGRIERYVTDGGLQHTLPLAAPAAGEPQLFGIFLVGAYQEILGDLHNLFGDTDAVNVVLEGDGYRLEEIERGDTVEELLRYLHFEPLAMLRRYRRRLEEVGLPRETAEQYFAELKAGLYGYSYHED